MPNAILLLGAGFSFNWNGRLAGEVTNDLMSHLQGDDYLLDLLHRKNFEDALSLLQTDYRASGKGEDELRLRTFQAALSRVFDDMNRSFQSRQFDFSSDVSRKVAKFLIGFDAIFTLNQDLLLELHYRNDDVAIWHGTQWQGWEMPGLRPLPVTDHYNRASNKWRPEQP